MAGNPITLHSPPASSMIRQTFAKPTRIFLVVIVTDKERCDGPSRTPQQEISRDPRRRRAVRGLRAHDHQVGGREDHLNLSLNFNLVHWSMIMITYDDWYPSNYLKASDLDNGPLTLTVSEIRPQKMQDGKLKPCVFFQEDRRGLVLNVTNKNTLVLLTRSKNPADAVGLRLQLVQTDETYQGRPCKGIRIARAPAPASAVKEGNAPAHSRPAAAKAVPAARAPADGAANDLDDSIPY
jgi:hypothetical protein